MTSGNGDNNYAIFQNSKKTSHGIREKGPIQPVLMNILESNTLNTDLDQHYFNYEPRVQEK